MAVLSFVSFVSLPMPEATFLFDMTLEAKIANRRSWIEDERFKFTSTILKYAIPKAFS